jgi:hypothetical protein
LIAIDGKTGRRSLDSAGDKPAIHMVSAWANRNRLVLAQVKLEDNSPENFAVLRHVALALAYSAYALFMHAHPVYRSIHG